MSKVKSVILISLLLGSVVSTNAPVRAQNFGGAFQRKRIVLARKLPPTGHIEGTSISVKVTGGPADVNANMESLLSSLLISNDSRLRTVDDHADVTVKCRITTYTQPPPLIKTQETFTLGGGKNNQQPKKQVTEVTGTLTTAFEAQDSRGGRSIAADSVSSKFDQEFPVPNPQAKPSVMTSILNTHIPKLPGGAAVGSNEDKPPTQLELRDKLIHDTAFQIASRLVNTTEQVEVYLATGGGLDEANKLIEQKLWTRALEQLETMPPFGQADQDAYRLYNLGVVNEALGYQSEDVTKARKYLQEAAIDYGKAIDAKPAEKYFLQPQTRIDTALAHYKTLGDRMTASAQAAAAPASAAAPDALTNADVISMIAARLDEANIIDTIQHAPAVKFDLTARGQIDLAKSNVNGHIIAAMKLRARANQ